MATLKKNSINDQPVLGLSAASEASMQGTVEERRARRMTALKKMEGIWSDRADIPADGLEYERQLRSEWPG